MMTSERRVRHLSDEAIRAILAEKPHGCITALRLRALAVQDIEIVDDRALCPFNPAGPNREHEFTDTCERCQTPKCPHCDCHAQ